MAGSGLVRVPLFSASASVVFGDDHFDSHEMMEVNGVSPSGASFPECPDHVVVFAGRVDRRRRSPALAADPHRSRRRAGDRRRSERSTGTVRGGFHARSATTPCCSSPRSFRRPPSRDADLRRGAGRGSSGAHRRRGHGLPGYRIRRPVARRRSTPRPLGVRSLRRIQTSRSRRSADRRGRIDGSGCGRNGRPDVDLRRDLMSPPVVRRGGEDGRHRTPGSEEDRGDGL